MTLAKKIILLLTGLLSAACTSGASYDQVYNNIPSSSYATATYTRSIISGENF